MGGKTDEVKGRLKEAAGALTGNDKLKHILPKTDNELNTRAPSWSPIRDRFQSMPLPKCSCTHSLL
jgi:hypothetical protein